MAVDKPKSEPVLGVKTTYVVDEAPDLPKAVVSTDTPDPVIDTRLIEIRNAQAKAEADRVNAASK